MPQVGMSLGEFAVGAQELLMLTLLGDFFLEVGFG